jgi:hypothetical protein
MGVIFYGRNYIMTLSILIISSTPMSFVIRCGTPDCDWGHRVSDLGQEQLKLCYSEFRKHCMQTHDLQVGNTNVTYELGFGALDVGAH